MDPFTAAFMGVLQNQGQALQQRQLMARQQQQMAMLERKQREEEARQLRSEEWDKRSKAADLMLKAKYPEAIDAVANIVGPLFSPVELSSMKQAAMGLSRKLEQEKLQEIGKTAGLEGRPFSMTEPTQPVSLQMPNPAYTGMEAAPMSVLGGTGITERPSLAMPMQLPLPGYTKGMVGETPYWLGQTPLEQSYVGYNRQQGIAERANNTVHALVPADDGFYHVVTKDKQVIKLDLRIPPKYFSQGGVQGKIYRGVDGQEYIEYLNEQPASPQSPQTPGGRPPLSSFQR